MASDPRELEQARTDALRRAAPVVDEQASKDRLREAEDALAQAEERQRTAITAEERARAGDLVRDRRYDVDRLREHGANLAARLRESKVERLTPDGAKQKLAKLDEQRAALDPTQRAAFDERTSAERAALAAKAPPAAQPTMADPAAAAARAKDRAAFHAMRQTNPIAAASFADARPWVHDREPEGTP